MTVHLSARVAWHMDGWNGRVCTDPAANTYCVGAHSYPGDIIRETRDLPWEKANGGRHCAELTDIPPCVYSINAFGEKSVTGYSDPPAWYPAEQRRTWEVPASTVCIWPFEEMYRDEVHGHGGREFNYDLRLRYAKEYLDRIEPDSSLVFYYANYSNPYSGEDDAKYVIVGVSRVKSVSGIRNYDGMTPDDRARYGGGFVWAADLTSHYPDEGLRLPYHLYADHPEEAAKFLVTPPNPRNFKYATRQFSDDEALEIIERIIEAVEQLQAMDDRTEDWSRRLDWLHTQVGLLWRQRGLYPGMTSVLSYLKAPALIPWFKEHCASGTEHPAKNALLAFLDGSTVLPANPLSADDTKTVRRRWMLLEDAQRDLIREVLTRFDLPSGQLEMLLGPAAESHGITADATEMRENPYVRTSEDHEHAGRRKASMTCTNARRGDDGRVTTASVWAGVGQVSRWAG